jgi:glucuronoarabinoxylan endo-1,4-beta-xylanase
MKKQIQYIKNNSSVVLFSFLVVFVLHTTQTYAQSGQAIIYLDSTRQVIQGFGAANIVGWRPDMTDDEITTAFGTGDGQLGFTILRLRIPYYSNDFSLYVPTAKKAYDLGVKIIASPWTPPASMKTNNNIVGGELNESSYQAYADHLKSFADYMAGNGVPLYAVSVQNEPDVTVTYESCDWSPQQMVKFMSENANTIGTKVIAPESFQFRRSMSDPILNDSAACANLDIVGGHIYGGGLASYPLAQQKGKEVWMTEYLINSPGSGPNMDTSLAGALATAKSINDCMNANMSTYLWWYIVRYYGPIDDGTKGVVKGSVTKKGYVMSQFSRFIRPGYLRINATSIPQSNIYLSAYRSDSKVVIVVVNNSPSSKDQTFTFANGSVAKFTPYVTSQTKNCEQGNDISVTNGSFTTTLDASSVTTFVSDASLVPVEMLSFTANAVEDKIHLSWITATEKNNRGFEIQRSVDKQSFVTIGYAEGKGTTTERQSYSFIDYGVGEQLFYRLKQIDLDGTFQYSNIVEVSSVPKIFTLSQNFPNPFNPVTQIKYSIPEESYISLIVYNLVGEKVATLFEGNQKAGYHVASFDGSKLAGGVYLYRLNANDFTETRKLIILK